jgi:hypothetical protein
MTRLSTEPSPGFQSITPDHHGVREIQLDGITVYALRCDTERGFVDVTTDYEFYRRYGFTNVHRLWGTVTIKDTPLDLGDSF